MRLLSIHAAIAVLVLATAGLATEVHWSAAHWMAPSGLVDAPAASDLDGDGDYDIALGGWESLWWNVGSPEAPAWEYDDGGLDPPSGSWGGLGFADVDDDGDPDMVAGYYLDGNLRFVRNIGTPQVFAWQYEPPPFPAVVPSSAAWPHFGDFDADGDLDIMATHVGAGAYYVENIGTLQVPDWVMNGGLGWGIIPLGAFPSMAPGDLDGDGDLDLVGQGDYEVQAWENVGTAQEFLYVENPSLLIGVSEPQNGSYGVELFDIDADGDLDLLIAASPDNYLYLNERIPTPVEARSWGAIKAMYR